MSLNPFTQSVAVAVDVSGTGDLVVIPAQAGKWFRVWRIVLTLTRPTDTYGDVQFKSGTTPIGGPLQLTNGATMVLTNDQRRWLMTGANQPLMVNLGGAGRLSGTLTVTFEDE